MNKYKVFIEGRNHLVSLDGEAQLYGFYTTRFVEEVNAATAKEKALELVARELDQFVSDYRNDESSIVVEEIEEMGSFSGIKVPGGGFTWFKEEVS